MIPSYKTGLVMIYISKGVWYKTENKSKVKCPSSHLDVFAKIAKFYH